MAAKRRVLGAEFIAALMWEPRTLTQLTEHVGTSKGTVMGWIKELRTAGVVYIHSYRPQRKGGNYSKVYAIQPKPFEHSDAEFAE
jgi:predicted transcriptional regulator